MLKASQAQLPLASRTRLRGFLGHKGKVVFQASPHPHPCLQPRGLLAAEAPLGLALLTLRSIQSWLNATPAGFKQHATGGRDGAGPPAAC